MKRVRALFDGEEVCAYTWRNLSACCQVVA